MPATPTPAAFKTYLEKRGSSPSTISQYIYNTRRLEEADDPVAFAVDELTGRTAPGDSPLYRRAKLGAFRAWARCHKNEDLLEALSKDNLRLPAANRARAQVPLPPPVYKAVRHEIDRADYLSEPVRAHLGMMANRGFRRSDVLRMKRSEVTGALRSGVLSYTVKGRKNLEFGVLPSYRRYLEILADQGAWNQVVDLVSVSWSGAWQAISKSLHQVAENIDLGDEVEIEDVRPHVLRRSYSVIFYDACGRDPVKLQQHMGWSNVLTALKYVDFAKREELDEVAAKMTENW